MTQFHESHPSARNVPPLLYPTLLIAGIAVIIASMLGIAAMSGLLPGAQSKPVGPPSVIDAPPVPPMPAARKTSPAAPSVSRGSAEAPGAPCASCGVVESVRTVEAAGQESGAGAVAGSVVGGILGKQEGGDHGRTAVTVVGTGASAYTGHELKKNMNKNLQFEIRVRMDDRSLRTFAATRAEFGEGQRVRISDGRLVPLQ